MPRDQPSSSDGTSRRTYLKRAAGVAALGLTGVGAGTAAAEAKSDALGPDGVSVPLNSVVENTSKLSNGLGSPGHYRVENRQATELAYTPEPSDGTHFDVWVHSHIAADRLRNVDDGTDASGRAKHFETVYLDVSTDADDVIIRRPTDTDRFGVMPHGGPDPDIAAAGIELLTQAASSLAPSVGWVKTGAAVADDLGLDDALLGDSNHSDLAGFRLSNSWNFFMKPEVAVTSPFTVEIPENASREVTIRVGAIQKGYLEELPETPMTEITLFLDNDGASWRRDTHGRTTY